MNQQLQRALLLMQQGRHARAIDELRSVLATDSNDAMAHAMLSLCLSETEDYRPAIEEAEQAIVLAPNMGQAYYAHSVAHSSANRTQEARQSILRAIELEPFSPANFAQLSQIEYGESKWQASLEAAEQGLAIDPEDSTCTNLRAAALVKLGRKMEADDSLRAALSQSPEDAFAHANMGWSSLEQNQPDEAMEHFSEALRLKPDFEWAQAGIVEAMKARYFIYRIMLMWFLWMMKLKNAMQWKVLIGAYIGYRIIIGAMNAYPDWAWLLSPFMFAYIAFAVMTWLASPLFNLLLRTHRFGRLALSEEQTRISTWVGICVLALVVLGGLWLITGGPQFMICAVMCLLTIPPITRYYSASEGWPRATLTIIILGLGIAAIILSGTILTASFSYYNRGVRLLDSIKDLLLPFMYTALAAQFATQYLTSVRPNRLNNSTRFVWIAGGVLLALMTITLLFRIGSAF